MKIFLILSLLSHQVFATTLFDLAEQKFAQLGSTQVAVENFVQSAPMKCKAVQRSDFNGGFYSENQWTKTDHKVVIRTLGDELVGKFNFFLMSTDSQDSEVSSSIVDGRIVSEVRINRYDYTYTFGEDTSRNPTVLFVRYEHSEFESGEMGSDVTTKRDIIIYACESI